MKALLNEAKKQYEEQIQQECVLKQETINLKLLLDEQAQKHIEKQQSLQQLRQSYNEKKSLFDRLELESGQQESQYTSLFKEFSLRMQKAKEMEEVIAAKTKDSNDLQQSLVELQGKIHQSQVLYDKITESIVVKKQQLKMEQQKVRYFKEEQEKKVHSLNEILSEFHQQKQVIE